MINKRTYPSEIEVWYIIPFLRGELAREMKNRSVNQKKIAYFLDVTGATISHYVHNKRALKLRLSKTLKHEITAAVDRIIGNKSNVFFEVQRMVRLDEVGEIKCMLHKKQGFNLKECKMCQECRV